jgi:uncharacterized protein (TIGR03435 family)
MNRVIVLTCALLSTSIWAQSFEVAAIKPSQPATGPRMTGFQNLGGGRFNTASTSLRMLIAFAYNVKDYQISGGPGWANSELYDITAKAAA